MDTVSFFAAEAQPAKQKILEPVENFVLPLKGAPAGAQEWKWTLGTDFFKDMENTDILSAAVEARATLKREGDVFGLSISVEGTVGIACDRCLKEMRHTVNDTYRVSVKLGEHYDDSSDTVIVVPERDGTIDVSRLVYDTIVLTIPIKNVHPDGQCDAEMEALLAAHRAASVEDGDGNIPGGDPRWAELGKLRQDNN